LIKEISASQRMQRAASEALFFRVLLGYSVHDAERASVGGVAPNEMIKWFPFQVLPHFW